MARISPGKASAKKKANPVVIRKLTTAEKKLLQALPSTPFPKQLSPMLATLTSQPFNDEDWEFEIKWDGYRAIAFMQNDQCQLRSRNNQSFDEQFYPVYEAISNWGIDAVVDGEIVVLKKDGQSDFAALQNWQAETSGQLCYYLFDILWLDGKDLTGLPLHLRKKILEALVPDAHPLLRTGMTLREKGEHFFEAAKKAGLEGIVAKRSESNYVPGARSRDWLKIKVQKRQEVVIAGYTRKKDSPKLFSALLLGVYKQGKLEYAGKVGTGFSDKYQKELMAAFKKITRIKCPFHMPPSLGNSRFNPEPKSTSIQWLKPELVGEINFTEITADGIFRHPSFIALRSDKTAPGR